MMLTDAEVQTLRKKSRERVEVACGESHAHSAPCLIPIAGKGTDADVTVCLLADELLEFRMCLIKLALDNSV